MPAPLARRAVSLLLALLLCPLLLTAGPRTVHAAPPQVSGEITDLGPQIPGRPGAVRSEQSAQGALADGRYLTYFANSGGPGVAARFFAMDLSGATVAEMDLPVGTDVLTLVYSAASRTVFVAANTASNGHLYEWDGKDLRQVASIAGQLIARLAPAPDGPVYIGTFAPSNGRLHVYSGGVVRDLGQPLPGESYVRSLVVDRSHVWLSNYREAGARLVRVDRATNAATVIPAPAAFAAEWSAMDMSLAGDHLFLRTVNLPLLFAYNRVTGRFDTFDDQVARVSGTAETPNVVPYIDGISPYGISPLLEGRYVYFQRSGAGIMRVDVTQGLKTIRVDKWNAGDNPASWPGASVAGPVSFAWLQDVAGRSGHSLVATTIDGKVVVNTPKQTSPHVVSLQAQGAPSTIISLGTDDGGAVYSGGFNLPSGVGRFDPAAGVSQVLAGPQIEGFGWYDGSIVMGGYTGNSTASAPLYLYSGGEGPELRTYINNSQERPVAMVQVGTKVAVGTVPIKNTLGGALTLWDPATNALTVKRNLVPDHSIISLATHGGLVVGGSSNVGGTGATPTATSGRIFTHDPTTGVTRTFTPPRAESSTYSWVAAITPDPEHTGRFWAISTGYVIQFAVASDGSISLTRNLGAFPDTSSPTGKELGIQFVGGTMFATVGQELAAIDTVTGERTTVAPKTSAGPVVGLVKTGDATLYFSRGAHLYRYTVTGTELATALSAPTVTSPDVQAVQGPGSIVFAGTGTRNSTVTLSDGTRSRSTVVLDGGAWTMGAMDFVPGTHTLTFTATLAGFAPQVTRVTLRVSATPDDPCAIAVPRPVNVAVGGYNTPHSDYAFEGTGTPGTVVTMVNGTRTRSATVRPDGTWSMNPVWFGWWAGTTPFTASFGDCAAVTNLVDATFATKPTSHVAPLVISHTATEFYPGGNVSFKGKGTPGATITMRVGNQTRYAAVSTTGRWHMRAITVSEAPITVALESRVPGYPDRATTMDVHFGTAPTSLTAPVLTSPGTGTVPAGEVVFSGKGTPSSKVSVTVDGRTVSAFVRSSGRWDLPAVAVARGTHDVTMVSTSPGLGTVTSSAVITVD